MILQVVVTQEAAIGLYKSLGFKEVRIIKNAVKRGEDQYDELEMELDLNPS
jgi:ribosomal protein S18 acetylase RimI-like enzyme